MKNQITVHAVLSTNEIIRGWTERHVLGRKCFNKSDSEDD
jgi:hypothetical protein